ncbi:MAG: YiiX/YebB-like N1pC/P60 family cysteine hydrolase [candidate division Zixibacteria bacterium]|nr:YiiX/YebB-like N1pC/P60 family cysteine hydrolase [candidate division Zixibacteria bacterium]
MLLIIKSQRTKWLLGLVIFLCCLYAILLIPDSAPPVPPAGEKVPFAWNRDDYWSSLETQFKEMRHIGCINLSSRISDGFTRLDTLLARLQTDTLAPSSSLFSSIEGKIFELGMLLAACPERFPDYIKTFSRLRTLSKDQSIRWDMNSQDARDCIYRLLYGGRTAIEEIMLQSPEEIIPKVAFENDEPSVTPSAAILGVKIHSGDILVSRGGAPTSALIARGNDYPGNFSHVALVYVDDSTGTVSIIESHIEKGVAIATIDDYLKDTKLRVMVLRLRSDLSQMQSDPMLPHKAASYALQRAKTEHIPYDFAMDAAEPSKLFCSEVVSQAYNHVGIKLWTALSHISSPGAKAWLSAFGVRNFTTEEPSDLEYDPQLRVVAEWRDYQTLYKDRVDNAVVDIMLENADKGEPLGYDWYMLPVARMAKAYSTIINQVNLVGPVPEGMNAAAALRNKWFSRKHQKIKDKVLTLAEQFRNTNGYSPPYWELIKLARQANMR